MSRMVVTRRCRHRSSGLTSRLLQMSCRRNKIDPRLCRRGGLTVTKVHITTDATVVAGTVLLQTGSIAIALEDIAVPHAFGHEVHVYCLWVGSFVADGVAVNIHLSALCEAGCFVLMFECLGVGILLSFLGTDDACEEGDEESGPHFVIVYMYS